MTNWDITEKQSILNRPSTVAIDIEFEDIRYIVPQKNGKKHVIKGVSGCFKAGEMTAIMGPSGAGKSSLLNILTGFREAEGTIRCTGPLQNRRGAKQHSKYSCYILQDDSLDPLFTVEETMKIAAELKLGRKVSEKAKQFLIEDILEALLLIPCRNTRCQMISGGQKKRLSVALELIGNPSVLFLDEPTTGLDSSSSKQVITVLKTLVQQGRNIICTIHQPSASLFELFDFVYVMAEGKCIYQGSSTNVVSYLASFDLNCPKYHNPADYLLEVANGDYGKFTDLLEIKGIEKKWRNYTKTENRSENNYIYREDGDNQISIPQYEPSEAFKLWVLIKKALKKTTRDWTISSMKLLLHFVVGIFLGLTYFDVGNDGSKTINNVGFLLISVVYLCYTSMMPAVLKFPSEVNILKKEWYNNWYKLRTYFMAFILVDMPLQVMFVLSYLIGSFLLSGQILEWIRLSKVFLVMFLSSVIASSMGIFFGTIVNPINGTFLGAIMLALMLVVAGFLILFNHMSATMYLLSYISYISYAISALVQAIYINRGTIPCPEDVEYCPYSVSVEFLKEMGMDKTNFWGDIAFLFLNIIALRIISFCTLKNTLSRV